MRSVRESVFLVCQVVRLGDMHLPQPEGESTFRATKARNVMRRPFGVAALNVTDILNGNIIPDDEKQYYVPMIP